MSNSTSKTFEPGDEIWVQDFNADAAQEFREQLLAASKVSAKKPIIVYIDSYGGAVDSLSKMIDSMDEVENPIITVVLGKAMSAGAILLSHGDYRFVGPNARIMVHEVSSWTAGNVNDIKTDAKEIVRLNDHFMTLLAKNCGMKGGLKDLKNLLKENEGREKYLTPSEAVSFGIVDHIGIPKIRTVPRYEIVTLDPSNDDGKSVGTTKSKDGKDGGRKKPWFKRS